jgi:hypothetical protein
VRDVTGQVEHLAPHVFGQDLRDRHAKRLANP